MNVRLALEASRVDWLNCAATVMGKGRKERSVPFSARTGQALLEYAQVRSKAPIKAGEFFLGKTGKKICRSKARKLILRYGKAAASRASGGPPTRCATLSPCSTSATAATRSACRRSWGTPRWR